MSVGDDHAVDHTVDHTAVVPTRHAVRLFFWRTGRRTQAIVVVVAATYVELQVGSAVPLHLRSGPTTVAVRGPPRFL